MGCAICLADTGSLSVATRGPLATSTWWGYNAHMTMPTTIFHIAESDPQAVETALSAIFAGEERPSVLRLEGTYSAVLARVTDPDLDAAYRYLILRPKENARWTTLLELGNRTEGLDTELSRRLNGAPVFALFAYGEDLSGYRYARGGASADQYVSDPEYAESLASNDDESVAPGMNVSALAGHPARFADLLPTGIAPEEFARVVLAPGYWEEHGTTRGSATETQGSTPSDADEDDEVDEIDRLRCIGLGLEFWRPESYPFAEDLEEIPNAEAGPAVVLAFA